jgi:hypothetical protein
LSDEFLCAVNKSLIQDSFLYQAIPLNRFVDLVVPVAHGFAAWLGGSIANSLSPMMPRGRAVIHS